MHTTTKKNLGRDTREQESLAVGFVLRLFVAVARRSHTRAHMCVCVCVGAWYFWDKELCKHQFTSGGHYCPWTRGKLPVRHFVSAILFARYLAGYFDLDALRSLRYLFVCTYARRPLVRTATPRANAFATTRTGWHVGGHFGVAGDYFSPDVATTREIARE